MRARPGLLGVAVAGRERSVARRNVIAESFIKVEPRVALALARAPVRHELIDATLEIVEFAPKRLQTAAAHVRELRGDALRVRPRRARSRAPERRSRRRGARCGHMPRRGRHSTRAARVVVDVLKLGIAVAVIGLARRQVGAAAAASARLSTFPTGRSGSSSRTKIRFGTL